MQACRSVTAYSAAALRRTLHCVSIVHHSPCLKSLICQNAGVRAVHIRTVRISTPGTTRREDQKSEVGKTRQRKIRRPSPAPVLIDVLRSAGHDFALPNDSKAHHVDLSYVKPGAAFAPLFKRVGNERDGVIPAKTGMTVQDQGITLQSILAQYVRQVNESKDDNLRIEEDDLESAIAWEAATKAEDGAITFLPSERGEWSNNSATSQAIPDIEDAFLEQRGYNREDVKQWADILCEKRSEIAARRMLAHQQEDDSQARKPLPIFLLLFFLRRPNISPEALRFCLILGWQEVTRRRTYLQSFGEYSNKYPAYRKIPIWDDHSLFLLIIRLLRHTRMIWSEAIVTIAAMFSQYLKDSNLSSTVALTAIETIRLTTLYNRVLNLISLPLSQHPFHSVTSHERAQFDLLRDMTLYDPPLQINREGYRAIIAVQLAQKKTSQERDWENLKARSWPPWKQDKTGLDSDKDRLYGTSRAMHVINRSQEAGYGPERWESTAAILAGWDVDETPTIQTRALLIHKAVSSTSAAENLETMSTVKLGKASDPNIHAKRISSARTLQEAWAFFLQYKADNSYASLDVYLQTLSKIAAEDERVSLLRSGHRKFNPHLQVEIRPLNAGDGSEVVAPPEDPNEATYLKSPPLSFDELVMEMFGQGLHIRGHHLGTVLSMTNSLENGIKYLLQAAEKHPEYYSLLAESPELDQRLARVDKFTFNAWVALLCRFPVATLKSDHMPPNLHVSFRFSHVDRPVLYALRLVRARKAIAWPPWHSVLATLGKPYVTARLRRFYKKNNPQRFEHSAVVQSVLHSMSQAGVRPDQRTLQIICRAVEPAIIDAQNIVAAFASRRAGLIPLPEIDTTATTDDIQMSVADAARLLGQGPQYIQSIFNTIYGVGSRKASSQVTKAVDRYSLPRLLAPPYADALHAYMRVLGVLQDWQGIFNFVEWMVKYRAEIDAAIQMPRNGPRLLRRTLVAARVYLERSWIDESLTSDKEASLQMAPDKTIANVKKMVVETKEWGGWPTDEEVAGYCAVGRFPQAATRRIVKYGIGNEVGSSGPSRVFRYGVGEAGSAKRV